MSRRDRINLTRRLARLEGDRGGDMCVCANPVRMAWKEGERTEIEGGTGTCSECGGELIVVLWAFDPRGEENPATKRKRTQAKAKLEKAAPALVKAHNADGTRDWSRLTDEELAEAHDAIKTAAEVSAPKQEKRGSPKAWRSKQDLSVLDMEF